MRPSPSSLGPYFAHGRGTRWDKRIPGAKVFQYYNTSLAVYVKESPVHVFQSATPLEGLPWSRVTSP